MIDMSLDVRRLKRKFEQAEQRMINAVGDAIQMGFAALVAITPEDTGFLKASWYISIGGSEHPNPPDYEFKKTLHYPAGRQSEFTSIYAESIAAAGHGGQYNVGLQVGSRSNLAVSRIVYRNTAPYADAVESKRGFMADEDQGREWAHRMIINTIEAHGYKLHTR